jgi:hypothetical protein
MDTQDTDIQIDNMCSEWMMKMAASSVYLFVSDVCPNGFFC